MEFRPSKKSFFVSLLWALSPLIVAGIVTYFMYESIAWKWLLWIANGVTVLFSLYLLVQSIYVHLETLYLDNYCIRTSSPLVTIELKWEDIVNALLLERINAISRTDHLLILQSYDDRVLLFNTSTLDPKDEEIVIRKVKEKTNLEIQRDSPSI